MVYINILLQELKKQAAIPSHFFNTASFALTQSAFFTVPMLYAIEYYERGAAGEVSLGAQPSETSLVTHGKRRSLIKTVAPFCTCSMVKEYMHAP